MPKSKKTNPEGDGIDRDSLEYKAGRLEAFGDAAQLLTNDAVSGSIVGRLIPGLHYAVERVQSMGRGLLERMRAETAATKKKG